MVETYIPLIIYIIMSAIFLYFAYQYIKPNQWMFWVAYLLIILGFLLWLWGLCQLGEYQVAWFIIIFPILLYLILLLSNK